MRYRRAYVLNNISTPQCLREAEKLNTIKNAQTTTHFHPYTNEQTNKQTLIYAVLGNSDQIENPRRT